MTAIATRDNGIQGHPNRWQALLVLLAANFMNLLDVTIVNVALPSIQRTTDAGPAALQWIVAGYLFVFAVGLLAGGRLGDRHGHKQVSWPVSASSRWLRFCAGSPPHPECSWPAGSCRAQARL